MDSVNVCNYLEMIRYKRRIPQVDFIYGIISMRQYRRYMNGESKIPIEVLDKLCSKLEISTMKLLKNLEDEKGINKDKIHSIYNSVANNDLETAKKQLDSLDKKMILNIEGKMFLSYTIELYNYKKNKINNHQFLEKICVLVDYPNVLKKDVLSDIEALVIAQLLSMNNVKEKEMIIGKLLNFIAGDKYVLTGDIPIIRLLILIRVAKYYGIKKEYKKVIDFCNLGLEIANSYSIFYAMDYYNYYLALAYYELGKTKEHIKALFDCFNTVYLKSNLAKNKKFETLVFNDFGLTYKDVVSLYSKQINED